MAHINRKYIDSHWLIFAVKGFLAILFGAFMLFDMRRDFATSVAITGVFLLSLSIVEFVNALYRARQKTGWAVSVSLAIVDAVVALALLFTFTQDTTWHLYIIAGYTFLRGVFEITSGFRTTIDPTDRFTWVFGGIIGAVMGIVILNSSDFFVRFFGVYMMICGTCSIFYGIHNRAQKIEDKEARKESASLAVRTRKRHYKKVKTTKAKVAKNKK